MSRIGNYEPNIWDKEEFKKRVQLLLFILGLCSLTASITLLIAAWHYKSQIEAKEKFYNEKIDEVLFELDYLKFELETCKAANIPKVDVIASCYQAVKGQTDSTPLITADGTKIGKDPYSQRIAAISRDLLDKGFSMGDTIRVEGTEIYDGLWVIHDKMNKRFTNKIDLLVNEGMKLDLFSNVKISKYEK